MLAHLLQGGRGGGTITDEADYSHFNYRLIIVRLETIFISLNKNLTCQVQLWYGFAYLEALENRSLRIHQTFFFRY